MGGDWGSVEVQRLRSLPVKWARVRSLLGELRTHTPCGVARKNYTHTKNG